MISVSNLVKKFGDVTAVDDISFRHPISEIRATAKMNANPRAGGCPIEEVYG